MNDMRREHYEWQGERNDMKDTGKQIFKLF